MSQAGRSVVSLKNNSGRRLFFRVAALVALGVVPIFGQAPAGNATRAKSNGNRLPEGVEVLRDLVYKMPGGESLKLDLYRPQVRDPASGLAVVVWVHGGGWLNGSKDRCPASWLAQHGFAVASINYRLTDRAIWPAQIEDCRDAVVWLRAQAERYQLDAENIGAWGSSAGGHLVALMGTMPTGNENQKVAAVCDWFGPTELLTMPPNTLGDGRTEQDVAGSNGAKLLGETVKDVPDKARNASPIEHVSADDSAFLIMHGSEDPGVPLEQSEKFHQRLRAAGVESGFHIVEGAGHGGKAFQSDAVRAKVLKFFEHQLK